MEISFTIEWLYLYFLHWSERLFFRSSGCVSKRMIVLNQWVCGEASPCLRTLNISCADRGGKWLFTAKDCLQCLEVAMHFLKSNSIVLCIEGELDGLTQLILAELGSKIQTLHVLWDWVAHLRRRRTSFAKVIHQRMLCEHCSSMCFLQNSYSERCIAGDVYGRGYDTQGSEVEEAPSVRRCSCWLGLQASLPDRTGSACLGVPHLLSGGKLLNRVQTCHFIAWTIRENICRGIGL